MSRLSTTYTDDTGREVTTVEHLEGVAAAWQAAADAIRKAWEITPSYLIHERGQIGRKEKDQTIAYLAAGRMAHYAEEALASIRRNAHARENGREGAAETDLEAAERWNQR